MTSCEILVTQALSSPLVRAMMRGLEEAGCPLNIARHVVCEPCNNSLAGGWVTTVHFSCTLRLASLQL